MYLILLTIFIVIIFSVFLLSKWKKKYGLSDVSLFINHLLKAGMNNGYLVITEINSKYFVQLAKYIHVNKCGVELTFPKAQWSSNYYDDLLVLLKQQNINYEIFEKVGNEDMEFIKVDFKKDSEDAFELVKKIFIQLFGFDNDLKLYLELNNVSPWNESIDSSSSTALGIKDGLKTLKNNEE